MAQDEFIAALNDLVTSVKKLDTTLRDATEQMERLEELLEQNNRINKFIADNFASYIQTKANMDQLMSGFKKLLGL